MDVAREPVRGWKPTQMDPSVTWAVPFQIPGKSDCILLWVNMVRWKLPPNLKNLKF